MHRRALLFIVTVFQFLPIQLYAQAVNYDVVYIRAPRYGDTQNTSWQEVSTPLKLEPGQDLVLLHPNGNEEVLVAGGVGAVVDPTVSFDGQWIYYSFYPDVSPNGINSQRSAPFQGADIYKINVATRQIIRLTFQEWTPNTGVANWASDHLNSNRESNKNYLGYGIFNLGPCPLPGGKLIFSSSRNGFLPNNSLTFPNLQLFVADEVNNKLVNIEQIGHLNLGSALHPTVLKDGRVVFSSYEGQGMRDGRLWGIWDIWPDGRKWGPIMSAFAGAAAMHFQGQLSNERIAFAEYYNLNNNGLGAILTVPPRPPSGVPPFGDPDPNSSTNPQVREGIWFFSPGHPAHLTPRYFKYPFSPVGLENITAFTHGKEGEASRALDGSWAGKATHPSGAPGNDLLITWSSGPSNHQVSLKTPAYDGGIYIIKGGTPITDYRQLVLIKNSPNYNEQQPRAVVPYQAIYGVTEPVDLPWMPNDGGESIDLPAGTPFGLVGTSSFYKRNTKPGIGISQFNGLEQFNTSQNENASNWTTQGADAGIYSDSEIYAVRILAMEPTTHISYGPGGEGNSRRFYNYGSERLRILGEIPLRKFDSNNNPIMDVDGNPDTSFLAKIPADIPFTFQTIDKDGLVLNMSQTWHQLRPGEVRNDCGGCHAHAQRGTDFYTTAASRAGYKIPDLTKGAPILSKDSTGKTVVVTRSKPVDVEYYRDIKPILQRSCVQCHSLTGRQEAKLALDDGAITNVVQFSSFSVENTYNRLANDGAAKYGIKPVISANAWRGTNASRYIKPYQSRRSLLAWKIFGRRLDGWTNASHPTEAVPGDATTLPSGTNPDNADIDFLGTIMPPPNSPAQPLTEDEKMTIARWIDLGCPVTSPNASQSNAGWFADDLRPTLTVSLPRRGATRGALSLLRFGAFDYYSGLNIASLSVKANFTINGNPPGTELAPIFTQTGDHIWTVTLSSPITSLTNGVLTVTIKDNQGNISKVERTFNVSAAVGEPSAPTGLRIIQIF